MLTEIKSAVRDVQTQLAVHSQILQMLTSGAAPADERSADDFDLPVRDMASFQSLEDDLQVKERIRALVSTKFNHFVLESLPNLKVCTK